MSGPFNQLAPTVPTILNTSNCFVFGNTASGTAMSVRQYGAGSVAAFSNASGYQSLFISSTGLVGIGTANPGAKVSIVTSGDAVMSPIGWDSTYVTIGLGGSSTDSGVGLGYNATSNYGILHSYTPASAWRDMRYKCNSHTFYTGVNGSTTSATITSTGTTLAGTTIIQGSVGIGTASPGAPLVVVNSAASPGNPGVVQFLAPNLASGSGVRISLGQGGGSSSAVAGDGAYLDYTNFSSIGASKNTFSIGFTQGATNILFVQAAGNVGIGTSNPLAPLSIYNTGGHTASYTSYLQLPNSPAGSAGSTASIYMKSDYLGIDVSDNVTNTAANKKPIVLCEYGGNVGIGTMSPLATMDVLTATGSQWVSRIVNVKNDGGSSNTCFIHSDQAAIGTTNYTGSVLDVTSYPNDAATNLGYIARFGTSSSDGTSMDPRVVILAGNGKRGYVGIQTTNPQKTLDVFGNVRAYNMTQISLNQSAPNGTALTNITFTVSWDTAQGDGQFPIIIETAQTVGATGGGYWTRISHVFVCSFNDNSTNPSIFSSTIISNSNLSITAAPTVTTGSGRASATSVTVTTAPGYASTLGNRSYNLHARVICVPPGVGNIYFT